MEGSMDTNTLMKELKIYIVRVSKLFLSLNNSYFIIFNEFYVEKQERNSSVPKTKYLETNLEYKM